MTALNYPKISYTYSKPTHTRACVLYTICRVLKPIVRKGLIVMVASITKDKVLTAANAEYGIELKEVDFKEFDRRRSPRITSYASFLESLESSTYEIEFIV